MAVRVNSGTSLELRLYSGNSPEELRSQSLFSGLCGSMTSAQSPSKTQSRSVAQTQRLSCLYSTKGGRLFWDSRRTHVRHRLQRYHILPSRVVWLGGVISAISCKKSARSRRVLFRNPCTKCEAAREPRAGLRLKFDRRGIHFPQGVL